jgi:hypothetical protein
MCLFDNVQKFSESIHAVTVEVARAKLAALRHTLHSELQNPMNGALQRVEALGPCPPHAGIYTYVYIYIYIYIYIYVYVEFGFRYRYMHID